MQPVVDPSAGSDTPSLRHFASMVEAAVAAVSRAEVALHGGPLPQPRGPPQPEVRGPQREPHHDTVTYPSQPKQAPPAPAPAPPAPVAPPAPAPYAPLRPVVPPAAPPAPAPASYDPARVVAAWNEVLRRHSGLADAVGDLALRNRTAGAPADAATAGLREANAALAEADALINGLPRNPAGGVDAAALHPSDVAALERVLGHVKGAAATAAAAMDLRPAPPEQRSRLLKLQTQHVNAVERLRVAREHLEALHQELRRGRLMAADVSGGAAAGPFARYVFAEGSPESDRLQVAIEAAEAELRRADATGETAAGLSKAVTRAADAEARGARADASSAELLPSALDAVTAFVLDASKAVAAVDALLRSKADLEFSRSRAAAAVGEMAARAAAARLVGALRARTASRRVAATTSSYAVPAPAPPTPHRPAGKPWGALLGATLSRLELRKGSRSLVAALVDAPVSIKSRHGLALDDPTSLRLAESLTLRAVLGLPSVLSHSWRRGARGRVADAALRHDLDDLVARLKIISTNYRRLLQHMRDRNMRSLPSSLGVPLKDALVSCTRAIKAADRVLPDADARLRLAVTRRLLAELEHVIRGANVSLFNFERVLEVVEHRLHERAKRGKGGASGAAPHAAGKPTAAAAARPTRREEPAREADAYAGRPAPAGRGPRVSEEDEQPLVAAAKSSVARPPTVAPAPTVAATSRSYDTAAAAAAKTAKAVADAAAAAAPPAAVVSASRGPSREKTRPPATLQDPSRQAEEAAAARERRRETERQLAERQLADRQQAEQLLADRQQAERQRKLAILEAHEARLEAELRGDRADPRSDPRDARPRGRSGGGASAKLTAPPSVQHMLEGTGEFTYVPDAPDDVEDDSPATRPGRAVTGGSESELLQSFKGVHHHLPPADGKRRTLQVSRGRVGSVGVRGLAYARHCPPPLALPAAARHDRR